MWDDNCATIPYRAVTPAKAGAHAPPSPHADPSMEHGGHVYILASKPPGVLYIGVTARLLERLAQHRRGEGSKFVSKWRCNTLVHAQRYEDIRDAITR